MKKPEFGNKYFLCWQKYNMVILTRHRFEQTGCDPEAIKPLLNREIPELLKQWEVMDRNELPIPCFPEVLPDLLEKPLFGASRVYKGAEESMDALFPTFSISFRVMEALRHD